MKTLFYIEPLIELGKPYWKEGWGNYFCRRIINSLNASPEDCDHLIILGEGVREYLSEIDKTEIIVLNQQELLKPFGNYLKASSCWFNESFTEDDLNYYCNLIDQKVGGFVPDLIISFSNAPFLKRLFPDACLLCMEYSLFSRAPFPESWFFDSEGVQGGGVGASFKKIQSFKTHEFLEFKKDLEAFKEEYQSLIIERNPFKSIVLEWRKRFEFLVLVPLQFSNYSMFDEHGKYKNQFDFAYDVLSRSPSQVGLVFCEHPQFPLFDKEVIRFFSNRFPNFLYSENFSDIDSPAQYLISDCDAVMTLSSSVGLQTLLWGKGLISLSNRKYLDSISEGYQPEDLLKLLSQKIKFKDDILFWLITRYAVPRFLLEDPLWTLSFFKKKIAIKSTSNSVEDYYFPLADIRMIFSRLKESLIRTIPLESPLSLPRKLLLMENDIRNLKEVITNKELEIDLLNSTIRKIYSSKSWRITRVLRDVHRLINK